MTSVDIAVRAVVMVIATACAGLPQVSDEASDIARDIEGAWRTSAALAAAYLPGKDTPDLPEHTMTLRLDPTAIEQVPPDALDGLALVCCGYVEGVGKPHRFFLGTFRDRAFLLLLSEGYGRPFGDSDGGFVSLRRQKRPSPDVLLIEIDSGAHTWVAYERT